MTTDQIVTLVIVLSVLLIVVGLVVFILVRRGIYTKYVLVNSTKIRKLEETNNKYIFKIYNSSMSFHYRYDKKSNYTKTETGAYLGWLVRNDIEKWVSIRNAIEYNKNLFAEYKETVKAINDTIDRKICEDNKKSYKYSLRTEERLFKQKIKMPDTDIAIKVTLQYVSPKGKVNISKADTFNYKDLARIVDSVSTKRMDKETYQRISKVERGFLSDGMRYDVLKRDNFKCVLCGMSSKDGAILHVDHIIPISKGGKTEMNNLRTLCEKCNIGKSNKIE